MKTKLRGVSPFVHPGRSIRSRSRSRRALALTAVLALLLRVRASLAGAPPAPDVDPLDLFLDAAAGERTLSAPPSGAFAIGLEATYQMSSTAQASFGVLAFLQVPLERFFAPPRRTLADQLPLPQGGARGVFADPSPSPRAPRGRAQQPAPAAEDGGWRDPAAQKEAPSKPPSTEERAPPQPAVLVTGELARGAVRAACKAAKLDEADGRLDSLASRAKASALLPELRLRATRAIDESESLAPTEYDPLRRTATGGSSTWLEARATFRLDRLVFADDEIAVEKLRIARAAERAKLVAKVLELLEVWQRARTAEASADAKADARLRASLAAAASEASLDVLTNGWFSKALAAEKPRDPGGDATASSHTTEASCAEETPQSASTAASHDAAHPCARKVRDAAGR